MSIQSVVGLLLLLLFQLCVVCTLAAVLDSSESTTARMNADVPSKDDTSITTRGMDIGIVASSKGTSRNTKSDSGSTSTTTTTTTSISTDDDDYKYNHFHQSQSQSQSHEYEYEDLLKSKDERSESIDYRYGDDIADKCSKFKSMNVQPTDSFQSNLIMTLLQAGVGSSMDDKDGGTYNSMICWLYNLKLNIPDEHFKSGIFSMSIHDMVCTSFEIRSTSSTYNPSTNKAEDSDSTTTTDPSLSFSMDGISANCKGKYKSGFIGGTVNVTVNTIENKHSIKTETTFQPYFLPNDNNNKYGNNNDGGTIQTNNIIAPHSAKITTCEMNLQVPKHGGIKISGSISAHLIGLFSSNIAKAISKALSTEICPSIKTDTDAAWDTFLTKMDDYLSVLINGNTNRALQSNRSSGSSSGNSHQLERKSYITDGDDSDKNHEPSEMMNWGSDMPLMKEMMDKFNQFLSSHMNRGLVLSFLDMIGWTDQHHPDDSNKGCSSSTDCGLFFRGVNGLIRYMNGSGSVSVIADTRKFVFIVEKLGNVTLSLYSVKMDGLANLTKIEMLPKDDHTISIGVESLEGFHFDGRMELNVEPIEGGLIQGDPLHESFDLSFNISSVSMHVDLDVGILREKFKTISMTDIMNLMSSSNTTSMLNFFLPTLAYASIEQLKPQVHIDSFDLIPLSRSKGNDDDSLEISMDKMINHLIKLFLNEYDSLWTESLIAFAQGPIRTNLNKKLEQIISDTTLYYNQDSQEEEVIVRSTQDSNQYYNFMKSLFIRRIHDKIASEKWIRDLNAFIGCVTSFIREKTFVSKLLQNDNSTFSIDIEEVSLMNIDRIKQIDIFKAADESHMVSGFMSHWENHTVDYSSNNQNDLSMKLSAALEWSLLDLKALYSSSVSIKGILSQVGAKIKYDLESLNQITLYETLRSPGLLLGPITQDSGIYDFVSSIDAINMGFNVSTFIGSNDARHFNYSSLDDNKLGPMITSAITSLNIITQDIFNAAIHLRLNTTGVAKKKQQVPYLKNTSQHHHIFWFVVIGIAFLTFQIVYFYFYSSSKQKHFTIKKKKKRNSEPSSVPLSLAFHPKIPFLVRIIVPLVIVGTIIIFIVSSLSTGAAVDLEVSRSNSVTDGPAFSIPRMFTFSLGKTVKEMYQAKVYTLMALVLIFSGIWPYVKLLLMFIAWISNERLLTLERRERLLIWLDAFGKYSLVDSFVLVLMLVSFRFHVDLELPFMSVIDSFVIPKDGFYTFLCATILSLVIGHLVTYLHRYSMMPKLTYNDQRQKESLQNHIFENKYPNQQLMKMSNIGKWSWLSFNILSVILLLIGVTQKCFIFEFKGAAGLVLGDQREERYSLISLGTSLPMSVKDPSDLGIISIQWTYFFFALFMPLASIFMVNVLFYVPMTLRNQNRAFTFAEICNAWSAIEVFLLSVFASMLELSQFAKFMVGDHCDFLKGDFMKDLFNEEDTCFSVQSRLGSGTIYLCCGVLMQCFIMSISLRLGHQTIEERMEREGLLERGKDHKERADSLVFKLLSLCLFQLNISD